MTTTWRLELCTTRTTSALCSRVARSNAAKRTHTCTQLFARWRKNIQAHVHTHTNTPAHTHTHQTTHTNTHTETHTHTRSCSAQTQKTNTCDSESRTDPAAGHILAISVLHREVRSLWLLSWLLLLLLLLALPISWRSPAAPARDRTHWRVTRRQAFIANSAAGVLVVATAARGGGLSSIPHLVRISLLLLILFSVRLFLPSLPLHLTCRLVGGVARPSRGRPGDQSRPSYVSPAFRFTRGRSRQTLNRRSIETWWLIT